MKLPAGILFASGRRWYFTGMQVKGETISTDFQSRQLDWVAANDSGEAFDRLEEMLSSGVSYPINEAFGRDGRFDDDDIFLVYEEADLIELRRCVDVALFVQGR